MLAQDLRDELESMGAEVMGPVPTVADAMARLAREAPPDVAVLDVNLGGEMVFPLADVLCDWGVRSVFATGCDAETIPAAYAEVPR